MPIRLRQQGLGRCFPGLPQREPDNHTHFGGAHSHYFSADMPKMNAPKQRHDLFVVHRTVDCALRNLVAVDMHDRKNGPRLSWIDVLEQVPSAERSSSASSKLKDKPDLRSCGSCLSFAIANDTSNNKVGLIHDGAKGDAESVA
jgi:hypothetical protein